MKMFYLYTITSVPNNNICAKCSLSFIPSNAKNLLLTENLGFTPAFGPIEAR